jgi:AraC-like DNA-binding protein
MRRLLVAAFPLDVKQMSDSSPSSSSIVSADADRLFAFAQQCQVAVGLWTLSKNLLDRTSVVWNVLLCLPSQMSGESQTILVHILRPFGANVLRRERCLRGAFTGACATTAEWRALQACSWLFGHFQEPAVRLTTVAHEMGVTAPHLCRLLRRQTGFSFSTHLRFIRLLAVVTALTETRQSVKEVAAACGFASTAELDRAFHRTFKMTPTCFRRASIG